MMTQTIRHRMASLAAVVLVFGGSQSLRAAEQVKVDVALADLEFRVHLPSVGVLDWQSFDHAVNVGYRHARKVLEAISAEELALYQPAVTRRATIASQAPAASVDFALP